MFGLGGFKLSNFDYCYFTEYDETLKQTECETSPRTT